MPSGPRREILIVLPGLLLAIMIAMLDQLVVSTALPRIVGDLGGLNHLAWVVTAYVLASTVTTPLYGKLGDLYGRKRLLMIAIVIFLIGSALSGLAHSMDQLIAFRAIQGLGAGGLMVGALATIGDLVSPRERGQYMGYMMGAMTLAMIAGPLVGGYITDSFSWRWIFYINLPIGAAALIYLALTLHLPGKRIEHRVDYLGAAVLAVAATALVLLLTWGGGQYAWGSPQIVILGVITVVATARLPGHRGQGGRAGPAAARVQEPELLAGHGDELPARPGPVRGADLPAALPADRPARLGHHQRPAADPADAGLHSDLDHRRPDHDQDRALQGPAHHRRRDHDVRHVHAHPPGPGHLAAHLRDLLRDPGHRHGLPDADHHADRAEQRGAQGHGRGQQLADVLPADRRLDRRVAVRRDLYPAAGSSRCAPSCPACTCTPATASWTRPRSTSCPP